MPGELFGLLARVAKLRSPEMLAVAIVLDRKENPAAAHPRWIAELEEIEAGALAGSFASLADRLTRPALDLTSDAIVLAALIRGLPRLTTVCPPPGSPLAARARTKADGPVAPKVLARIRALLAKAEATPFAEEAEAFTAKAQKMMSEHSIERALLDDPEGTAPAAMRFWLDAPYTSQKSTLLSQIARANACRSVWNKGLSVVTVFGFDHDLASVDLLFTSLLVQANTEMTRAAKARTYDTNRVRSFRASFLIGFAYRIGERLNEVRAASAASASEASGSDLLPVLASRDAIVEDAMNAAFPNLGRHRVSLSNGQGYHAGTIAANRANLGPDGAVLRRAG